MASGDLRRAERPRWTERFDDASRMVLGWLSGPWRSLVWAAVVVLIVWGFVIGLWLPL